MPPEQNKILNEIEKGTEMSLLQRQKILDSVDGIEPIIEGLLVQGSKSNKILEAISENTKPQEIQKVELMGVETIMLKGSKGEPGDTPTDEKLIELIKPLIPEVKDGHTPTESELVELIIPLIPEPINGTDGKDYILTETDKNDIANLIEVPVVEKIIEKTETIKEVENKDTPEQLLEKIETLEETLDYSKLKNKPDIARLEENIQKAYNKQSSKTVSLEEIDNVNLTGLTQTNGKYNLGSGSSGLVTVTTNSQTVKYLNPIFSGVTAGNIAISANNVYMTPFLVQSNLTILGLAHNVSGTSTLSMGIYSGNVGELGTITLVTNSGVSVATSGTFATYNVTYGTPITLTPGLYWLAFATTAVVNTQTYPNGTAWNPLLAMSDALTGYQYMFRASVAGSGTTLPSSIATSVNWTAQSRTNAPMNCRGILA